MLEYSVRLLKEVELVNNSITIMGASITKPESVAAYQLLSSLLVRGGTGGIKELLKDRFGRPFDPIRPNLFLSIAHSKTAIAAAVSIGRRVGIDVEENTCYDISMAELVLTKAQKNAVEKSSDPGKSFIRYWVRKEALGKAIGRGIEDSVLKADVENDLVSVEGSLYCLKDICSPFGTQAALTISHKSV
jgi:4'-phosphopantetheinyl transferase